MSLSRDDRWTQLSDSTKKIMTVIIADHRARALERLATTPTSDEFRVEQGRVRALSEILTAVEPKRD